MADEMTKADWESANFSEALRRMPPPLPLFENGAVCPWCGAGHRTVTFGRNECKSCERKFLFGFPPWGSRIDFCPDTYVAFPHEEFRRLGFRADLIPPFDPPELLREQWAIAARMVARSNDEPDRPPNMTN